LIKVIDENTTTLEIYMSITFTR